jgi:hypothetical protein
MGWAWLNYMGWAHPDWAKIQPKRNWVEVGPKKHRANIGPQDEFFIHNIILLYYHIINT